MQYTYCDWPFLWSPADLSHSSPKYHPLNRLNLAFYCDNLINLYKRFYYYLFDMQCPRRGLLWYLKKKTGVIFQDVTIWHLTSQKKNCIAFFYQSMTGHLSQPLFLHFCIANLHPTYGCLLRTLVIRNKNMKMVK